MPDLMCCPSGQLMVTSLASRPSLVSIKKGMGPASSEGKNGMENFSRKIRGNCFSEEPGMSVILMSTGAAPKKTWNLGPGPT